MNATGAVLFRLEPLMPPQAYKTYSMRMPVTSHWRPATCDEAGCEHYRSGWVTTVDVSTELGRAQYAYLMADRTRRPGVQKVSEHLFKFVYGPGFRCFRSGDHRVQVGRDALFVVTGGDWRGNPMNVPARVHRRAEDWVDDFATHQDRLATAIQKG